jgi:hypothetical protein
MNIRIKISTQNLDIFLNTEMYVDDSSVTCCQQTLAYLNERFSKYVEVYPSLKITFFVKLSVRRNNVLFKLYFT